MRQFSKIFKLINYKPNKQTKLPIYIAIYRKSKTITNREQDINIM